MIRRNDVSGRFCRSKDQRFLLPGLHPADDAAQREVDDKIDHAGGAKQHHHVGNIHGAQPVIGACGAQQLADAPLNPLCLQDAKKAPGDPSPSAFALIA